jgi:nucleoid-associated protein YgaU
VVRRLQGEAFVDDEVLQQTLIVLHAENPQLAEQFKQFVAAHGRPEDIDLTVARLRSGTDDPVMPERMPRKAREATPPFIAPEPVAEAPRKPEPPKAPPPVTPPGASAPAADPIERPRPAAPRAAQTQAPQLAKERAGDESESSTSWVKYAAAVVAVLLIGAVGYLALAPKSGGDEKTFQATTAPLRQAANEAPAPPAPQVTQAAPEAAAKPAPAQSVATEERNAAAPGAESLQAAPATEQARGDFQPPAQQAAAPPADISRNGRPVAGSRYRVVRGDRLSAIAQEIYGDPSLYPRIQRANPSVRNADLIYFDQVITLPPKP